MAAQRGLDRRHQQRRCDSLAGDVGDSDTGPAIVPIKIIVIVTADPESGEAGAVDLQDVIFQPISWKKVSLHFGRHLELVCIALFVDHAADQLHVFNERSHLVGDYKQQALVFFGIGQI